MQRYALIGSNNFWYSTVEVASEKALLESVQALHKRIQAGDFEADSPEEIVALRLADNAQDDHIIKL